MDSPLPPDPLWLLSTRVSIVEAALLLLNIEPQGVSDFVESRIDDHKPPGYLAARNAIATALHAGEIDGRIAHPVVEMPDGDFQENVTAIASWSTVNLASLRRWLKDRNFSCGFLDLADQPSAAFMDPAHPRYSPKLAAAVEAWEAFDEHADATGRPKQRLLIWLRKNAARFGLTNDDGNPTESALEEIAKVANWSTGGGAPRRRSVNDGDESDPDNPF